MSTFNFKVFPMRRNKTLRRLNHLVRIKKELFTKENNKITAFIPLCLDSVATVYTWFIGYSADSKYIYQC